MISHLEPGRRTHFKQLTGQTSWIPWASLELEIGVWSEGPQAALLEIKAKVDRRAFSISLCSKKLEL